MYFCGRTAVPTITVEAQNIDRERYSHPQTTKVLEFESRNLKKPEKSQIYARKYQFFKFQKLTLIALGLWLLFQWLSN